MEHLFLLILLGFSVVAINSRPSQSEENNESQEELEYEEDNAPTAEDNLDDPRFGDEDSNNQDTDQSRRLLELNRNNFLQKNLAEEQAPRTNLDAPEYKPTRGRDVRNDKTYEATNNNDEFQSYGKRRRYIENNDANDQIEIAQHFANTDNNNNNPNKNNRLHNEMLLESPLSKRTFNPKKAQTDEGELLFEANRDQTSKADTNEYFNGPIDVNQRLPYGKQYYNQIKSDKAMLDVNSRDSDLLYYNRDRREAKKSSQGDTESVSSNDSRKESIGKSDSDNEEMAIKRHIKKMTGDELEQLLNSLSEEKRALLKKIIDDVDLPEKSYDSIIKREITKKAGAVEDNGYIETGQSESSKLQGGFTALEVTTAFPSAQALDITTTKQTENIPDSTVLSNQQKSQETNSENKADLNSNINKSPEKSDDSFVSPDTNSNKVNAEIGISEEMISKIENKREANAETMEPFEDSKIEIDDTKRINADDSYFFSKNEDMSQFLDDVEQSRSYDSSKIYKRDVEEQAELDSKLKSLEESFPNSDAYDESGPYSGPLIRVKRKNTEQVVKKRSAALLPEAKVGYYPYKSDNNDDDADEGNEFDDEGFYDPTPNLVSNNDNKNLATNSDQAGRDSSYKLNAVDQPKSSINDGTMNLGSDTDNVLSGVEGVDENLMFSSGLRNRRKTEGHYEERVDGNSLIQPEQGNVSSSVIKTNSDLNVPNYQDNDSFGGFPRSYEGDLGRYKRIRRLKQSHMPETPPNA